MNTFCPCSLVVLMRKLPPGGCRQGHRQGHSEHQHPCGAGRGFTWGGRTQPLPSALTCSQHAGYEHNSLRYVVCSSQKTFRQANSIFACMLPLTPAPGRPHIGQRAAVAHLPPAHAARTVEAPAARGRNTQRIRGRFSTTIQHSASSTGLAEQATMPEDLPRAAARLRRCCFFLA